MLNADGSYEEVDPDDDLDQAWLCVCGKFITDGCHCPDCGAEPPWGCPCSECQMPEDDEDGEPDFTLDDLEFAETYPELVEDCDEEESEL